MEKQHVRQTSDRETNRRTFLSLAGATVGVGALAGCIGTDDPVDPDPDPGNGDADPDEPELEFPTRDLRLVIPYGPGGGYDAYVRLTAPYLERHLPGDVSVNVQNVEGAGGQIATQEVFNAEPDGHTLQIINGFGFTLMQAYEDAVGFDLTEMTYYAQTAEGIWAIGVAPDSEYDSWEAYLDGVENEEVRFYSTGPGSGNAAVPALVGAVSGLHEPEKVLDNQVVYDGRGEGIQGILAGDVEVMAGSYSSILPFVQSGDLDIIMTCNLEDEPPAESPDSETLVTADVPNAEAVLASIADARVYAGPPGIPDDVRDVLRDAFEAAINDDEFLAEAEEAERPIVYGDGDTAEQVIHDLYNGWVENEDLVEQLYS